MKNLLQNLKDYLDTDEGIKKSNNYFEKVNQGRLIRQFQLERLHKSGKFIDLVETSIIKYESDKYQYRWLNRNTEPPETLFSFLMEYAEQYGRECNPQEWIDYSNMFTTTLYFCQGYYFNLMQGQGSAIKIIKQELN